MDFEVQPILPDGLDQKLLDGIARVSQENYILDMRQRLHAYKHVEALYRNARAANLDTTDQI
jgi:hypothetical protein